MARGKYDRGGLTEKEKTLYQRRLSHYLKDYRYRHELKAADVAETMGYAVPKYSDLESEVRPHGRFINSLDFLAAIASLNEMSIADFLAYLEPRSKPQAKEEQKQLYTWEKDLLEFMGAIAIGTRKEFVQKCKECLANGQEKIEAIIRVANLLADKDLKGIEALEKTLKYL